jgi:hypothetical protein
MGFLDDRPIAKIVSGAILIITTVSFVTGITPAENTDVLTVLIGGAIGFLFGASVPNKIK